MRNRLIEKYLGEFTATYWNLDTGERGNWPEPDTWSIIDTDKFSAYDDVGAVSYQDNDSGQIVDFDSSGLNKGKKGTWYFEIWGSKEKGTFSHMNDIPKILRKIKVSLPKLKEKIEAKIPKVAGWKKSYDGYDLNYEKNISSDFLISVIIWDIEELFSDGKAEADIALMDYGGYRGRTAGEEKVIIRKFSDIPKLLKKYEKKWKKK